MPARAKGRLSRMLPLRYGQPSSKDVSPNLSKDVAQNVPTPEPAAAAAVDWCEVCLLSQRDETIALVP